MKDLKAQPSIFQIRNYVLRWITANAASLADKSSIIKLYWNPVKRRLKTCIETVETGRHKIIPDICIGVILCNFKKDKFEKNNELKKQHPIPFFIYYTLKNHSENKQKLSVNEEIVCF